MVTTKPPPAAFAAASGCGWLVLILLAAGAYFLWPKSSGTGTPPAGTAKGAGKNGRGGAAAPVVAAKAHDGQYRYLLHGSGCSHATEYSDGEEPRRRAIAEDSVQGRRSWFTRAMCWWRSIRGLIKCMLTQAQGQLAKDQATLDNARIDLTRYQTLLKTGGHCGSKSRPRKRPLVDAGRGHREIRSGAGGQRASSTSPTATSRLRSPGASACAWWIRETWCTLPMPTGCW